MTADQIAAMELSGLELVSLWAWLASVGKAPGDAIFGVEPDARQGFDGGLPLFA